MVFCGGDVVEDTMDIFFNKVSSLLGMSRPWNHVHMLTRLTVISLLPGKGFLKVCRTRMQLVLESVKSELEWLCASEALMAAWNEAL